MLPLIHLLQSNFLGRSSEEENGGWLSEQEGLFLPFASHARHEKIERNCDLGPKGAHQIAKKSSAPRSSLIMIPLLLPVFFLRSTSLHDQGKQQKGGYHTKKLTRNYKAFPYCGLAEVHASSYSLLYYWLMLVC